jgi:hypothetical protein
MSVQKLGRYGTPFAPPEEGLPNWMITIRVAMSVAAWRSWVSCPARRP